MALEDLEARLAYLLTPIEGRPQEPHELHDHLRQKLEQFKAMGLPLPDELVSLQQEHGRNSAPPQPDYAPFPHSGSCSYALPHAA